MDKKKYEKWNAILDKIYARANELRTEKKK